MEEPKLYRIHMPICEQCLRSEGPVCHNPSCLFCRTDAPVAVPSIWEKWHDVLGVLEEELAAEPPEPECAKCMIAQPKDPDCTCADNDGPFYCSIHAMDKAYAQGVVDALAEHSKLDILADLTAEELCSLAQRPYDIAHEHRVAAEFDDCRKKDWNLSQAKRWTEIAERFEQAAKERGK